MNRNRLLIGVFIALVLAFLTSSYVYRKFKEASFVKPAPEHQTIVVAAMPLPLGTRLDASKLREIPWPAGEPVQGMFTKLEECTNRALITAVAENEPILEGKLAPIQSGAGLPATIPEGMRGLSVAVNEVVGVAGFVGPGTMVDVLATGSVAGGRGGGDNITRTILQNVRVLAAGQKIEQDKDGKPQTVPVITLLVTPDDAAKLTMAATEGKIQLALRNTIDMKSANPAPVTEAALFAPAGGAPIHAAARPHAAPAPPPAYTVEVIVGTKRETKSFTNP
jgi:pilus assembly protein CpaB